MSVSERRSAEFGEAALEVPENEGKWKAAAAKSILRLLIAPCQGSMDQNLQALFVGLKKTLRNHNNLKQR